MLLAFLLSFGLLVRPAYALNAGEVVAGLVAAYQVICTCIDVSFDATHDWTQSEITEALHDVALEIKSWDRLFNQQSKYRRLAKNLEDLTGYDILADGNRINTVYGKTGQTKYDEYFQCPNQDCVMGSVEHDGTWSQCPTCKGNYAEYRYKTMALSGACGGALRGWIDYLIDTADDWIDESKLTATEVEDEPAQPPAEYVPSTFPTSNIRSCEPVDFKGKTYSHVITCYAIRGKKPKNISSWNDDHINDATGSYYIREDRANGNPLLLDSYDIYINDRIFAFLDARIGEGYAAWVFVNQDSGLSYIEVVPPDGYLEKCYTQVSTGYKEYWVEINKNNSNTWYHKGFGLDNGYKFLSEGRIFVADEGSFNTQSNSTAVSGALGACIGGTGYDPNATIVEPGTGSSHTEYSYNTDIDYDYDWNYNYDVDIDNSVTNYDNTYNSITDIDENTTINNTTNNTQTVTVYDDSHDISYTYTINTAGTGEFEFDYTPITGRQDIIAALLRDVGNDLNRIIAILNQQLQVENSMAGVLAYLGSMVDEGFTDMNNLQLGIRSDVNEILFGVYDVLDAIGGLEFESYDDTSFKALVRTGFDDVLDALDNLDVATFDDADLLAAINDGFSDVVDAVNGMDFDIEPYDDTAFKSLVGGRFDTLDSDVEGWINDILNAMNDISDTFLTEVRFFNGCVDEIHGWASEAYRNRGRLTDFFDDVVDSLDTIIYQLTLNRYVVVRDYRPTPTELRDKLNLDELDAALQKLMKKFPFSTINNIALIFAYLHAPAVAPEFDVPVPNPSDWSNPHMMHVSLEQFDTVARVMRLGWTLWAIAIVSKSTTRMWTHREGV